MFKPGFSFFFFIIGIIVNNITLAETSIWKLSGIDQHFYIAGSLHMLKKTDYPLPEEFKTAYKFADLLLFETALHELQQPEKQQQLLEKGLLPEDENLQQSLSRRTYTRLLEYCKANDLPIENLNRLKPWMLVLTLTVAELHKHGIQPSDGIDEYFHRKALEDGKKTAGLVPVDEHIRILSSLDSGLSNALVESFLQEMETLMPLMKTLTAAWRVGDESTLNTLINELIRENHPKLHKKILLDRNKRWLDAIEAQIRSGQNTLIIVGVGHLIGRGSVIDLLRTKGYKLEKFSIANADSSG